jgi:hypothetical protein
LFWRARWRVEELRVPSAFDVGAFAQSTLRFETFTAVALVWAVIAVLIFPLHGGAIGHNLSSTSTGLLTKAAPELFPTLWAVQATVLGVFLVILTFIFQFISLRTAYETSLLPFMAERVHIKQIILVNLWFVIVEMLPLLLHKGGRSLLLAKYCAVLGLIFSVLSATYLLLQVLSFLRPQTIDKGLIELVKRDLNDELRQEQELEVASRLLVEYCASLGIEFSQIDAFKAFPAIRSTKSGKIVDIDLSLLKRFSERLKGALPSGEGKVKKCCIVAGPSDNVTKQRNVLARIPLIDRSPQNERILRRLFKIDTHADL